MSLYGILIILFFYVVGEVLSKLIGGFIPGNVIGMVLLFVALMLEWISPAYLRKTVAWFTSNMTLFFIPSSVGLMVSYHLIQSQIWSILATLLFSTILVMIVVGWIHQKIAK